MGRKRRKGVVVDGGNGIASSGFDSGEGDCVVGVEKEKRKKYILNQ